MTAQFKYIIIGKGMMGAAAARHLSLWTDGVALIGPGEPADHASHDGVFASHYDEARITRTIDPDPVWARLANRSIARYEQIARDSGIEFYHEAGCLLVGPRPQADRPSYVEEVLDAAASIGVDVVRLEDAGLLERFPMFAFRPGSEGVLEERRAGYINPRRLVEAQALLAKRQGTTLIGETVSAVRSEEGGVTVTTVEGNTYRAERVLVAAGGFTINEDLLQARLKLDVYARTVAFFEVDEAIADEMGRVPSLIWKWSQEEVGIYLLPPVRYPDGKLYLKIGGDPDDLLLEREQDVRRWFRSGGRQSTATHLARIMAELMPALDLSRSSMAACVTSFTPTGYPAVAMTSDSRVGVLTGGCGAAAKSSDEIGRLGAELIFHGAIIDQAYAAHTDFSAQYI
jgi:sarcosine oxidase